MVGCPLPKGKVRLVTLMTDSAFLGNQEKGKRGKIPSPLIFPGMKEGAKQILQKILNFLLQSFVAQHQTERSGELLFLIFNLVTCSERNLIFPPHCCRGELEQWDMAYSSMRRRSSFEHPPYATTPDEFYRCCNLQSYHAISAFQNY